MKKRKNKVNNHMFIILVILKKMVNINISVFSQKLKHHKDYVCHVVLKIINKFWMKKIHKNINFLNHVLMMN